MKIDEPTSKNFFLIFLFLLIAGCLVSIWGIANVEFLVPSEIFAQVTSVIFIYMFVIFVVFLIWKIMKNRFEDED